MKSWSRLHLLVVLLLAVILISCGAAIVDLDNTYIGDHITRVIDSEASVVCWIYDGYEGDGISCLPFSDTQLDLSGGSNE